MINIIYHHLPSTISVTSPISSSHLNPLWSIPGAANMTKKRARERDGKLRDWLSDDIVSWDREIRKNYQPSHHLPSHNLPSHHLSPIPPCSFNLLFILGFNFEMWLDWWWKIMRWDEIVDEKMRLWVRLWDEMRNKNKKRESRNQPSSHLPSHLINLISTQLEVKWVWNIHQRLNVIIHHIYICLDDEMRW